MGLPFLVFADSKGKIYSHPRLRMAVAAWGGFSLPQPSELIAPPEGTTFFYMPGRAAVGFDLSTRSFVTLSRYQGKKVFAAAAFLVPAYLRLYSPAYEVCEKKNMPLWAYAACGFYSGRFLVAATRVDPLRRQSPRFYDNKKVRTKVKEFLNRYPANRLYRHLANCALNYNCLAAKNLFLKRWEAPLPAARTCNARCIGCLSYQDSECAASHQRINFAPDADEIAQVAVNHLRAAPEAIVSFGQGCEGEPLTEGAELAKAVRKIRQATDRGTINFNTNASLPGKIDLLCRAGVDSFRVSLCSPREEIYRRYFRPVSYRFADVLRSMAAIKKHKKFLSINLFVFPGVTDSQEELKALTRLVSEHGVDMIQWRNLNIDPELYRQALAGIANNDMGILNVVAEMKQRFPKLKMGYFNPALR